MRILLLNWRSIISPEAGGAEIHCKEIFSRLANEGHAIQLVASCKGHSGPRRLAIGGLDVLHATTNEALFPLFSLVGALKTCVGGHDVIVEDVSKFPIFWPLLLSRILAKPFLIIVHHVHGRTLFRELPFPLAIIAFFLEMLGLRFYSLFNPYVVTVSESSKRELVSLGFSEERTSIVHNSFEVEFAERPSSRNPEPTPLIVYFGRVKRYKRLDHLILALRNVSKHVEDVKLVIAGKGDREVYEALAKLAEQQGLTSRIEMYGEVDEKQKRDILVRAWVYASASMKEGFGISPLEAEAFGVPVVSYDVPGLRDAVEPSVSGLLVKDGEIEELASALRLVLTDKELREKLSRGAIEHSKKYNWERSASQFSSLLESLLGSTSRL